LLELPALLHLTTTVSSTSTVLVHHLLRIPALTTLRLVALHPRIYHHLPALCKAVFANILHLQISLSTASPDLLAALLLAVPRLVSLDATESWSGFAKTLRAATTDHPDLLSDLSAIHMPSKGYSFGEQLFE
jgi:hypothetical protein